MAPLLTHYLIHVSAASPRYIKALMLYGRAASSHIQAPVNPFPTPSQSMRRSGRAEGLAASGGFVPSDLTQALAARGGGLGLAYTDEFFDYGMPDDFHPDSFTGGGGGGGAQVP